MRYVFSTAAIFLALTFLAPSTMLAQNGAAGLSIENYQFVGEQRSTRTEWFVTYRAELVNTGAARSGVVATLTSLVPAVKVVVGQNSLHFSPVPANGRVWSTDTFTILVDRSQPFSFNNLQWSFLNPVANPGPNQTAPVGTTINLNGSGSSNPSGVGTLSYVWAFVSKPAGSNATLNTPNSVTSSFLIDVPGDYVVSLTVNNGTAQDTRTVKISTVNSPPVAVAGPNQSVAVGANVNLNGSGSSDVDGDPLSYTWTFVSVPPGSNAFIGGFRSVTASFGADVAGTYIVQLIVNDGKVDSAPSTVTVTAGQAANTPPVANAGPDQSNVAVGATVQLNGAGSTDVNGDPLTYKWTLITRPATSTAQLSNMNVVNPTFVADVAGTYVAQLIVNDGKIDSPADTVTITTTSPAPGAPTANAGPNQTVVHGTMVQLNGSGTDPQNLPLTFAWSFTTRPAGSNATLSNTTIPNPTFVADRPGQFVLQLIVNNGTISSQPSTVTITTTNTAPVANAGPNQTVTVGSVVNLNGGGSTDADNDPLTYTWSFTTRPNGSTATLSAANSSTPTFVADLVGTYVVQLIVNDGFAPSQPVTVTINATSAGGIVVPANLTIGPGQMAQYDVRLAQAPANDVNVELTLSDPTKATLSSTSVLFRAGQTEPTRTVFITAGQTPGSLTVNATSPGLSPGVTNLTIGINATLTPANLIIPGPDVDGTLNITLSNPSQSNITFNVVSSNPSVASVPTFVPMGAGNTSIAFKVTRVSAGTAVITVSAPGFPNMTSNVTVQQQGNITLSISNANLYLWIPQTLTITLSTPATGNGAAVTLAGNATFLKFAQNPVTIPAGSTQATVQVTGIQVGNPTIGATAPGYNAATPLNVAVGATIEWVQPSLTVTSYPQELLLSLALNALVPGSTAFDPNDGITINLSSSRPDVVTLGHSTQTFYWDGSTAPVLRIQATAVGPGTTIIKASGINIPEVSMTITVTGPLAITTATLPNGAAGTPYSKQVEANGGVAPYTWAATGLPANLTINPTTGVISGTPNAAGTSTVNVTVQDSSNPKLSANATYQLQINPGAPASIAVQGGSNQSAKINTAFASPLQVIVKDANNNVLNGVTVTFTPPANGGPTGTFAGGVNTANTNAAGIATSPIFTANNKAGAYQVVASVNSGALTTNFSLTNTAGDPTTIEVSSGAGQSAALNQPFGLPLKALVKDAGGNPVPNVSVTFNPPAQNGASGTFAGGVNTATTGADGIATSAVFTANGNQGSYNVVATLTANPGVSTNFGLTNTVGTPATIVVSGGNNQSAKINTAFAQPLTATVRDANNNLLSGITVTFTPPANGGATGTFAGGQNTAVTNASGVATSAIFTANDKVGQYNVTAMAAANVTTTFSLTNTVGDPASIAVSSGSPQSAPLNTAFAQTLKAIVKDAGGNPVPNVSVTFTAPAQGGASGTFAGGVNTATTGADGIATSAVFTANGNQGSYNVTAAVTNNAALTTAFALTNTLGTPAAMVISGGDNQSAKINTAFGQPLSVTVRDSNNNLLSGITVTFTAPANGNASGTFAGGQNTAVTNASGVATSAVFTANSKVGSYQVEAAAGTVKTNFNLTNTVGDPASIEVSSGSGQSAVTGQAFGAPLKALVKDAGGNPVPNVSVTFTQPANGASGTFAGGVNTATTGADGIATSAVFTANNTSGAYNVAAAVTNNPALTTNFSLTNTQAPPATIEVSSGSNQSTKINTVFGQPLKALVKDSGGNPVPNITVTFTLPSSGPGATFNNGNTAVTDANGIATSAALTANSTVGTYNVTAAAGAGITTTFALTNTVGDPASIAVSSGSPQSTPAGQAFAQPLRAIVKDAGNNPVPNVLVTFTAPANGPSGTFAGGVNTATTGADGIATSAVFTANNTAGDPYNVVANVNGLNTNFVLTNTPGPAASLAISDGSSQSTAITTPFPKTLKVLVRDALNNPVSGVTVTFTAPASGPSGTFAGGVNTATSGADGIATSAVFTANATASPAGQPYIVSASSGALAPVSFLLTNLPGQAANIVPSNGSSPQSAVVMSVYQNALKALVTDSNGQPVPGVTVNYMAPVSGPSGTFLGGVTSAVTDASGIATPPPFTANAIAGGFTVRATIASTNIFTDFNLTNQPGPAALISVVSGSVQTAMALTPFANPFVARVTDSQGNPIRLAVVTFTAPASGPSGTFASTGTATATVNTDSGGIATSPVFTANGTTGGPYSVNATVSGVAQPAQFGSLNNSINTSLGIITVANATIGKNLQDTVVITLDPPAPQAGLQVTITSVDETKALVGGNAGAAGVKTFQANLASGSTSLATIVQALVDSGASAIQVSANGYNTGTGMVTYVPSGFALSGPNGMGSQFEAFLGTTTPMTVFVGRLGAGNEFKQTQQIRGGFSVNVPVASNVTSVGTVSSPSVSFTGGSNSATVNFVASSQNTGNTDISVTNPVGFTAPTLNVGTVQNPVYVPATTVNAIVKTTALVPFSVTVGKNLQKGVRINLSGPASTNVVVTITSLDPSKVKFSTNPNNPGTDTINVTIPTNFSLSPEFYVQAFDSAGSVGYTASAPTYGMSNGTVTLAPSGLLIESPGGQGATSFQIQKGIGNAIITVYSGMVSNGSISEFQNVAAGLSIPVTVESSNPSAGTITNGSINIAGGTGSASTQFTPVDDGQTAITASSPGYQGALVMATVVGGRLVVSSGKIVGNKLQDSAAVFLAGQIAGPGGVQVTLQSNSPSLLLATSPTGAGSSSINVTIAENTSAAVFYLQGAADSGTATVTASAPAGGFQPANGTVTLVPSSFIMFPSAVSGNAGGSTQVSVFPVAHIDGSLVPQPIAGGPSIVVPVQTTNAGVAGVPSSLTFVGGSDFNALTINFVGSGGATVSISQPAGFTNPVSFTTTTVTVN